MTYNDMQRHVTALAQIIRDSGKAYTSIVAVGRGGMPVAAMLAHALEVKTCHYINYARGTGWQGDSFNTELPAGALVVDDAAESGGTLATLAIQYGSFDSAVIVTKPDCRYPITHKVFMSTDPADFIMPFEFNSLNA